MIKENQLLHKQWIINRHRKIKIYAAGGVDLT